MDSQKIKVGSRVVMLRFYDWQEVKHYIIMKIWKHVSENASHNMPTRFRLGAWEEEPPPQRTFICSFCRSQMNLCIGLPFLQRIQSLQTKTLGKINEHHTSQTKKCQWCMVKKKKRFDIFGWKYHNELFTYFSTLFHPKRFIFSFRSVNAWLCPAPATDEIGAESRGTSLAWLSWWQWCQTNQQTNRKANGSPIWLIMAPC